MTKTLEEAVDKAKSLPDNRQRQIAEIILAMLGPDSEIPAISF